MSDTSTPSLSFFGKTLLECPVCGTKFRKEELRTGRGRLIAGDLTIELRRLYEPSKKFGKVYPLVYPLPVCPECRYSVMQKDFDIPEPDVIELLSRSTNDRIAVFNGIFEELNFEEESPRGLAEGVAAYYYSIMCYDQYPVKFSPSIKRGISALRCAWLCNDLHKAHPEDNFDYMANIMYRKARFFYNIAVDREQTGKETMAAAGHFGPDVDKNFGYDGVLYLAAYLEYAYGPKEDTALRVKSLENAKRTVARIFGMGKASKNKPTAILENAKELHSTIGDEVQKLKEETVE